MRESWRISFAAGPKPFSVIERLLREAGLDTLADRGRSPDSTYEAAFSSPDGAAKLSNALDGVGLPWTQHHSREWEPSDLDAFPAVMPHLPVRGTGGASPPTEFEERSACLACGTGAVPRPNVRIELPAVPSTPFRTEDLVPLVPAQLTAIFTSAGASLTPAASADGQLHEASVVIGLPLVDLDIERSDGLRVERQCPVCRRDGHFWAAYEPVGPVTVFDSDFDRVAFSRQCFGNSARDPNGSIRHVAQPWLVMTTAFFADVFAEHDVPFIPVRFV